MIEIKFFPKGSTVYTVIDNNVKALLVSDVFINADKNEVNYNLSSNGMIRSYKVNHKDLFANPEELKNHLLKQFDELIPEVSGEQKEKNQS